MARRFVLTSPRGNGSEALVLLGSRLITKIGDQVRVQDFPNPEAAEAHLRRVLQLRAKGGFTLDSEEEIADAEALIGGTELGIDDDGRVVTFQDRVDTAHCTAIIERLAQLGAPVLQLVCDPLSPGSAWTDALLLQPLPSVRAFAFDTHFQTVTRQDQNDLGDLADTLEGLPNLERALFTGRLHMRPTTHGSLRKLTLMGNPLSADLIKGLTDSTWPRLEQLVIALASEVRPITTTLLATRITSMSAPRLHRVHIADVEVTDFLTALCEAPIPTKWTELVLAGFVRDEDELLSALATHRAALASLERLVLPLDDVSTDAGVSARHHPNISNLGSERSRTLPESYLAWE